MRAIATTLLLGLVMTSSAQEVTTDQRSPWRFGASGTYGFGFRTLASEGGTADAESIIKLREDIEEPAPNMGFSLDILFDLGGRWGLSSGCQYVDMGYRTRSLPLTTAMDPEGLSGATAQIDYRYRYLSIPLLARYRIGNGRFRFEPALGLSGDVLLTAISKVEITERDGSTSNSSSTIAADRLRTLNLSGMIELNLLYALGEQWQLRLAPTGRQHLLWMSDSPVTERLYAVSLSIGIVHRF
jgi:hypothetical protein